MSKYCINDTTLDNIAAPIMSMRGITGGLTPEEMGTNANAVLENVTDALAAIAAKGVDISGMNSDNLAALIEALDTGGANLESGTFTLSSSKKTYTLTHGVGKTPNFALAILESTYAMDHTYLCFTLNYGNTSWIIQNYGDINYGSGAQLTKKTSATITSSQSDGFGRAQSTSIVFSRNGDSSYAAKTYRYIVGVV